MFGWLLCSLFSPLNKLELLKQTSFGGLFPFIALDALMAGSDPTDWWAQVWTTTSG